jgi:hypothetical protein
VFVRAQMRAALGFDAPPAGGNRGPGSLPSGASTRLLQGGPAVNRQVDWPALAGLNDSESAKRDNPGRGPKDNAHDAITRPTD